MARRNNLTFLDLFAGAGGLSEGFRQAGWTPLAGSDIDPDAMATYSFNFPEAAPICGDLRLASVKRRVLSLGAGVDVVAGGPPCQAFSQVRNHSRLIEDPRNSLYREFVALVRRLQPRAFVMENVPGLAQMGVLEQVLHDLSCRGTYRVEPNLVDAAEFGVPQSRRRIVFIGIHRDMGGPPPAIHGVPASAGLERRAEGRRIVYKLASSGETAADTLSRLRDAWDESLVTAAQAIGDLAGLATGRHDKEVNTADLGEPSSAFQKLMRDSERTTVLNVGVPRMNDDTRIRLTSIPPGGNYLDLTDQLQDRYLTGQLWGPHNGSSRLSRRHYYAYRRLHPDIWSWTLNTKADSVYHWALPRALSVREFARLQSFPDRFAFVTDPRRGPLPGRIAGGPGHSCYRQAGNAVPPLLAKAIADALAAAIG
jgi:DNA (cytosine-5)-methyltransferase 1